MRTEINMTRVQRMVAASLVTGVLLAGTASAATLPPGTKKFSTNCFDVALPKDFVLLSYKQTDKARPYMEKVRYVSAGGQGRMKVFISCQPLERGPFLQVFERSLKKLATKVAGWKESARETSKEKNRNVITVLGEGFLRVIDPQTKRAAARKHVIARLFRRYHKVNMQVSITVAAAGGKMAAIEKLMDIIGATFDEIDAEDKADLKSAVVKPKAKKK